MKGQAKISLFYKVSGGNLGAKREFSCPLYKSMRQGAGILGTIGTGPFPRPWDCRSRSSPGPQKADLRSVTGPKITRTGVDCRYCTASPPHPWPFHYLFRCLAVTIFRLIAAVGPWESARGLLAWPPGPRPTAEAVPGAAADAASCGGGEGAAPSCPLHRRRVWPRKRPTTS